MDRKKILLKLDEINEQPPGTFKGDERIEDWTSLTWLDFMLFADEEFGKSFEISQLKMQKTANDIVSMLIEE